MKKTYLILCLIFIIGLALRITYTLQINDHPLLEDALQNPVFDQHRFGLAANDILDGTWGKSVDPEKYGLVYPYFLATIYKFFGHNPLAARLIQSFIGSLLILLVYFTGKEIFNSKVGLMAAFITAFYGIFIFYDAILLRASLVTFLNVAMVLLLSLAKRKKRLFLWLLPGLILGLSTLTRPNMLLIFICAWILFGVKEAPVKKRTLYLLLFILGVMVVMLPASYHNWKMGDGTTPISTDYSPFWVGNVHDATGVTLSYTDGYHKMVESCGNNIYSVARSFIGEIKNYPAEMAKIYLRKTRMFFNGYEIPSNLNYYLIKEWPSVLKIPLFSFSLIVPFALLGIFLSLSRREWLLHLVFFVLSFSVILFHIQARYRLPSVPFFILFSSYAFVWLGEQLKRQKGPLLFAMFLIISFFTFLTKTDTTYGLSAGPKDPIRVADYLNIGSSYSDRGDYEKAIYYLERGVEREPNWAGIRVNLGVAYALSKNYKDARLEWEKVLQLEPGNEKAKSNLQKLDQAGL